MVHCALMDQLDAIKADFFSFLALFDAGAQPRHPLLPRLLSSPPPRCPAIA